MKKGDYVTCVKSIDVLNNTFIKDKQYEIKNIEDDGYTSIYVYSDKFKLNLAYGFELYHEKSKRYFYDFFITKQKIRKLKLDKINESNL